MEREKLESAPEQTPQIESGDIVEELDSAFKNIELTEKEREQLEAMKLNRKRLLEQTKDQYH